MINQIDILREHQECRFHTIYTWTQEIISLKFYVMKPCLLFNLKQKRLNLLSLFLIAFSFFSSVIHAQNFKNLVLLTGYNIEVYYSGGQEERAMTIASRCQKAIDYNSKLLGFNPEVTLLILSPEDWSHHTSFPLYGMPHYTDKKTLIVASSDNEFWNSMIPPLNGLTSDVVTKIKNSYSKKDGRLSMQPFFDLLVLHELGHAFHIQANLNMQRKWMGELFCNLLLHTYITENEPTQLDALTVLPNMVENAGTAGYKFLTLHDFENKYREIAEQHSTNYGWYQCRFHNAAKNIYDVAGKEALQKLWIALQKEQTPLTDEQFVTLLANQVHSVVADVMLKWDVDVDR
jgi:hypothetical protein